MDASALAAWYAAGLSTVVAIVGGVAKFRAGQTRVEVSVRTAIEDQDPIGVSYDVVVIEAVNWSAHSVQIVECGFDGQDSPNSELRITIHGEPLPRTVQARSASTFGMFEEDAPVDLERPVVAWVRLAGRKEIRSRPTRLRKPFTQPTTARS